MLLVVAWDGACFDLIQPFLAAGDLPVLSKFIAEGASRELRSTIPPVTFPAWTTFMTASSPDRHGITDFTVRKRGSYSLRFVNASDRRQPTIWALMNAADLRVGVYGFPATYPPEGLDGFQICGFDTPLGSGAASRATHPAHLAGELIDRFGGLGTGGPSQARIDSGWHRRALESMSSEIELRTDIALELLGRSEVDVFAVHYGESDTVSHQFWHFFDDASPRHRDDGPAGAVARVYREMDRALGRLLEAVGEGADVVLLSDHGSGGSSNRVVFWNRWLADQGLLGFSRGPGSGALYGPIRRLALSLVPAAWQARLFSRFASVVGGLESGHRFAGVDWPRTTVYSEELNYFPSLWFNLRGREPCGTVGQEDLRSLTNDVRQLLLEFRDPFDDQAVVEAVYEREELCDGPFAYRTPDLVLRLRCPEGYSYAAASSRGGRETLPLRLLREREMSGARGATMAGAHTELGLCVLRGPGIRPGRYPEGNLQDAGATVLALAGVEVSEGMNGVLWDDLVERDRSRLRSVNALSPGAGNEYSPEEEREVAEKLRDLGYLQ